MELVHVRLDAEDLVGDGHVVVPHARTGLDDVLEVGDDLVVTDQDGEFHGATVVSVGGDGHDPHYNLRIGARPVRRVVSSLDSRVERLHARREAAAMERSLSC